MVKNFHHKTLNFRLFWAISDGYNSEFSSTMMKIFYHKTLNFSLFEPFQTVKKSKFSSTMVKNFHDKKLNFKTNKANRSMQCLKNHMRSTNVLKYHNWVRYAFRLFSGAPSVRHCHYTVDCVTTIGVWIRPRYSVKVGCKLETQKKLFSSNYKRSHFFE